jgi:hypothetical protein
MGQPTHLQVTVCSAAHTQNDEVKTDSTSDGSSHQGDQIDLLARGGWSSVCSAYCERSADGSPKTGAGKNRGDEILCSLYVRFRV